MINFSLNTCWRLIPTQRNKVVVFATTYSFSKKVLYW